MESIKHQQSDSTKKSGAPTKSEENRQETPQFACKNGICTVKWKPAKPAKPAA
jgi:hypothetical protein